MLHLLDCLGVRTHAQPGHDLPQEFVRRLQEILSTHAKLLSFGQKLEKLLNVSIEHIPTKLRVEFAPPLDGLIALTRKIGKCRQVEQPMRGRNRAVTPSFLDKFHH